VPTRRKSRAEYLALFEALITRVEQAHDLTVALHGAREPRTITARARRLAQLTQEAAQLAAAVALLTGAE